MKEWNLDKWVNYIFVQRLNMLSGVGIISYILASTRNVNHSGSHDRLRTVKPRNNIQI